MTTCNPANPITLQAAASLVNYQYTFIMCDSAGKAALPTGTTVQCIGILQNAPASGEEAHILLVGSGGTSKVLLGATLDEGARVTHEYVSGTDCGKAKAAGSGLYPLGTLLQGGAEDELGEVILNSTTKDA